MNSWYIQSYKRKAFISNAKIIIQRKFEKFIFTEDINFAQRMEVKSGFC